MPRKRVPNATKTSTKNSTRNIRNGLTKTSSTSSPPKRRSAFLHLQTNEEREQFIEQFWQRRNPDPDSAENTFKEEHYRRIAYANEHFASGIPGWKTDRGRIYIMWGPPDEVDSHPSGGSYERPIVRRRRRNLHLPLRRLALPLYRRHRRERRTRIRRSDHDRRISPHHRPQRKRRLALRSRRRPDPMEQMGLASKNQSLQNTDGTHMAPSYRRLALPDPERIHPPGAVRQDSQAPTGEIQGPRSRGHLAPGPRSGQIRVPLSISCASLAIPSWCPSPFKFPPSS